MKIEYIKEPVWANEEKDAVNCIIKFENIDTEIPFTAKSTDVEQHGKQAFSRIISGEFGGIGDYIPIVEDSDSVETIGNYSEEYLKSLIYQVMDEIKETTV
jgi:hypothetical protein